MEKIIGIIFKIALVLGGMGLIKPAIIYFAHTAIEAQAHSLSYGAFSRALNGTQAPMGSRTRTPNQKVLLRGCQLLAGKRQDLPRS